MVHQSVVIHVATIEMELHGKKCIRWNAEVWLESILKKDTSAFSCNLKNFYKGNI